MKTTVTSSNDEKKWFYLKLKSKSALSRLRQILENSDYPHCFLVDLPDDYRGCCRRLQKDYLANRLLVQGNFQEISRLIKENSTLLRPVGQHGKATDPISMKSYRQLTLFFDKLDRDFVFESSIPPKAKPTRISGGSMSGIEGELEYRGIGGYRFYVRILDLCILSIRVDQKELIVNDKIISSSTPVPARWYILLCRREQEYYNLLTKRGYRAYIPIRKLSTDNDKGTLLMRGYVFLHLSPHRFTELFKDIPEASNRLLFSRSEKLRTPLIIPDKQFEDFVFMTERTTSEIIPAKEEYSRGDNVRLLIKGFEGVEGKLVKNKNKYQIFISLANLQSGYLLQIEKDEFCKI